jgi:hypothetical protein
MLMLRRGNKIVGIPCQLVEINPADIEGEVLLPRGGRPSAKETATTGVSGAPETVLQSEGGFTSVPVPDAAQAAELLEEVDTEYSADAGRQDLVEARHVLNRVGVRKFYVCDELIIGVWSDVDGVEIREALKATRNDLYPVRYLDGPGIPDKYKGRHVAGEAVPMNVLQAMMQNTTTPWEIRDQMLAEMQWCPEGMTKEEWIAASAAASADVTAVPRPSRKRSTSVPPASPVSSSAPGEQTKFFDSGENEYSDQL